MKKLLMTIIICLSIISCKKQKTKVPTNKEIKTPVETKKTTQKENDKPEKTNTSEFIKFDWSKIPVSDTEIGSFPYITPPKGMHITDASRVMGNVPMNKPYSTFWEFDYLAMADGENVFIADGKRAYLEIQMKEKGVKFLKYKFDKSVEEYLKNIGAVKIFEGNLSDNQKETLHEKHKDYNDHMANNIYECKMYALNNKHTKVFFQISSNPDDADIAVIELEGFKQTIKAPKASEIKDAIEKEGKAVLHINFDVNKATLQKDGEKIVNEIKKVLEASPNLKLSIEGHTDNTGNAKHNKELSEKRATTVKFALAGKGIDINRLSSKGFGAEKPLVKNDSEENKAKNRRVELVKK